MKIVLSILVVLLCIIFDGSKLYLPWSLSEADSTILYSLRLPRTVLAFVVGGALSLCGLVFQSLFKNDLASPYTLGTASMASLGACIALFLGLGFWVPFMAILFSSLSVLVMMWFVRKEIHRSSYILILCGIILSYFSSSIVMLLKILSSESMTKQMLFWLLGDLNVVGYEELLPIAFAVILYLFFFFKQSEPLSLMAVGPVFAHTKGVHVKAIRAQFLVMTALLVGILVAYCGPIGFVGIIIPHLVRIKHGSNIKNIGLPTFFYGGFYLCLCEYIAQTLFARYAIPVGIVTSFTGAPFFIWSLLRRNIKKF